jgi:chromosomal replication initiator protein
MKDAEKLWAQAVGSLRSQIPDAAWRTCFEGVRAAVADDGCVHLTVPSALARKRIEERYLPQIRQVVSATLGLRVPVVVEVAIGAAPDASEDTVVLGNGLPATADLAHVPTVEPGLSINGQSDGDSDGAQPAPALRGGVHQEVSLNPRYTFDTFVIGSSNRFAHAAALSVAENPARSYNPLFIHGDSGLGKTHLLHAIGNYVVEHFRRRVRYVQTESFMNHFVEAIRTNTGSAFKRYYRQCDVLLVDDIQFMEGKEGLQEEFFHTFCSVYEASHQIVIT